MRPTPLQTMLLLSAALALTLAGPSAAPGQNRTNTVEPRDAQIQIERPGNAPAPGRETGFDIVRADDLIGRSVIGADGEFLGRVNNFLLSVSGGIEHLIVASSGFLGIGGREVTVPWSDTRTSSNSDKIRVTLTKADFEDAPEYQRTGSGNAVAGAEEQ